MSTAMMQHSMQPSLLYILHTQHRYYTSELGNTHKELGIQYGRLASIELDLIQRHEKNLTRREKKRLQWSRAHAKATVKSLESQQTWLHEYIRQCNDLIASCESHMNGPPVTQWSGTPCLEPLSPESGLTTPTLWWTAASTALPPQTQYWDLSMLRERRESSPSAVDSGFHEANNSSLSYRQAFNNPFSDGMGSGLVNTVAQTSPPSKRSSISEKDDVPDSIKPLSPARFGASASSSHKRRYSENAIQLIESRLAPPKQTHHHRGSSVDATPVPHRTLSVTTGLV